MSLCGSTGCVSRPLTQEEALLKEAEAAKAAKRTDLSPAMTRLVEALQGRNEAVARRAARVEIMKKANKGNQTAIVTLQRRSNLGKPNWDNSPAAQASIINLAVKAVLEERGVRTNSRHNGGRRRKSTKKNKRSHKRRSTRKH